MDPFSAFGLPPLDPSKMDPKLLMELSQLIQQLPPEQLNRMQLVMHNMRAGFDVRKDLEEFERSLPPGFREKLMAILAKHGAAPGATDSSSAPETYTQSEPEAEPVSPSDMNLREARRTILRAVAEGRMAPDEAEKLLFAAD
jgi:hypothetical protein